MKRTFVSRTVLDKTFEFLQNLGKQKLEAHALWIGKEDESFMISDVVIPKQNNGMINFEVDSQEVHRINVMINQKGLQLIAQIHTHPYDAFHSDIDDDGAILLLPGSLSIVIPNFGFINKDDFEQWAVYCFDGKEWKEVDEKEVKESFKII